MSNKINIEYIINSIRANMSDDLFEKARVRNKFDLDLESDIIVEISDSIKKSMVCKGLGAWMAFDGVVYRKINKAMITAIIKDIIDTKMLSSRYHVSTPDKAFNCVANTLGLTDFNPTRSIISFRNGIMDMGTNTIKEGFGYIDLGDNFSFVDSSPDYHTSIYIDTIFDQNAKCEMFDTFLEEVLPNIDDRLLVQDIFGYMFVDRKVITLEQIALFLGEGRNGKSVLSNIINGVVGSDNISSFSLYDLVDHPQADYKVASCNGKLLNYCPDMDKKDASGGKYKSIISGEKVNARHPHEQSFEAENIPPMVANINDMPVSSDQSFGHIRRQLIVKFGVTIPDNKVNTSLASDILKNEKSGVLNWIIEGTKRVLINKDFSVSESSKAATLEATIANSSVLRYLRDLRYVPALSSISLFNTITWFYTEYKEYCNEYGNKPVNRDNFKKQMERSKFIKKRMSSGEGYDYIQNPEDINDIIKVDTYVDNSKLPF